jgi:cytidylate kinase
VSIGTFRPSIGNSCSMTVVTLSASYGAGGSTLGPRLAERLAVPFLDRAIPVGVAERLAVPLEEAQSRDQAVVGLFERMVQRMAPMGQVWGMPEAVVELPDDIHYLKATEATIREHATGGDCVLLGRAGALVLCEDPRALHVRLDGPREQRIAQAVRLRGIARAQAERELDETDRARETYVRHFYRADARDPKHYHLVIDTTAIGLDCALELIVHAASAHSAAAA